ncbi:MAG: hypothetical protein DWQ11_11250 [Proteobacteria bacterium]|nr:MAG: hypothetical protein DWQ11_11250 [Pseudomonadota bacterium]
MTQRTIAIVVNARSANGRDDDLRARIEAALPPEAGRLLWFQPRKASRLDRVCQRATTVADLVVAVGGDGTVRTVAQHARARGKPMAIIPTGTYNLVARHLGIPLDVAEAARLAATGHAHPTACGDINGLLFFNHAAFGLYTRIIAARERHTAVLGRSRITAVLSGIATLFNRYPILKLRLTAEGDSKHCHANAVFFGANPLPLAAVDAEFAAQCDGRALGLVLMRHQGRRHVLMAALKSLFGRLSDAPTFELTAWREITVDILRRRRRLRVSIDGELIKCRLPLQLHYQPDALQIVRPDPLESKA